jgi:superfamily II DNA or RNA helicase
MCPDGYVYNLEVEENSNYFPEGFLVHNCHHLNTLTGMYGKTMQKLLSPIRLGFTATLPNTPEGNLVMTGYTGPVIGEFSIDDAVEEGVLAKPRIRLLKIPDNLKVGDLRTYKEVYDQGIVNNNARNRKIVSLIMQYSKEGKSVLVFVNQILHGDQICILAWKFGLKVHFVQGETPKEMRAELKERLKNKTVDAIIATAVWKEGVNVPSLDVVINAGGGKSEIQTLQIIGRGLRKSDGKKEVLIIDFFDPSHRYLVDHFGHRLCLYFDNGWLGKD